MKKVLVGLSGGVDSAVSAYILKNSGYDVIGATMVLTDNTDTLTSIEDARNISKKLGIPYYVIDLKEEFKKHVIDNFINSYKEGRTPNPCIECNKYFKFGYFYNKAKELGCDYIATGHYAKIENSKLLMADNIEKDQTYFLSQIDKNILPYIIFPLNKYKNKEEIREIARENNLLVESKKDSQEICFIPNDDYASFLESNLELLPDKGNFILKDGTILGKHKGIIYYTIGQRKGLGISYKTPLYVIEIDIKNNNIILGSENDLYHTELIGSNLNLLVDSLPDTLEAKVRYRSKLSKASVILLDNNRVKVIFEDSVKSITKGQSVVFYDKNVCLGGAIIEEILK